MDVFLGAGEEVYMCTRRIVALVLDISADESRKCFKYWESSTGVQIEKACGVVVNRCGILWRPSRVSVTKTTQNRLV